MLGRGGRAGDGDLSPDADCVGPVNLPQALVAVCTLDVPSVLQWDQIGCEGASCAMRAQMGCEGASCAIALGAQDCIASALVV